jgi:hypothetical protein
MDKGISYVAARIWYERCLLEHIMVYTVALATHAKEHK